MKYQVGNWFEIFLDNEISLKFANENKVDYSLDN